VQGARGGHRVEEMAQVQQQRRDGEDVVMKEVEGEVDQTGDATGVKCSRCAKKGHFAAACKAEIYCVICDKRNEHVNHKCPVLKMPRPVAHAVGYAVHGLGFYHIPRPPLSRAKKESRLACITVEGGRILLEEVKRQLERLFPGKWAWELKAHGESSFLAKFPSKLELQRAVAFGGADVRGDGVPAGVRLKFEEWREKEVGFLLPKVWIRVFGLRRELCEFLDLWAVGSMLGSTQIVDMETTRKGDFGRVLVAVLNPGLIPTQLDVVIGDHYFELEFEVEKRGFDENGEEVDVEWPVEMEECEGTGLAGGGRQAGVESSERLAKKQKRDEGNIGGEGEAEKDKEDGEVFVSWKEQVQNMSREEFEAFLKAKAGEILDKAAKTVIEDLADKVMGEADEAVQEVETLAEGGWMERARWWRGRRGFWWLQRSLRSQRRRSGRVRGFSGPRTSTPWLRLRGGWPGGTWSFLKVFPLLLRCFPLIET
jgi:hypothetical protein